MKDLFENENECIEEEPIGTGRFCYYCKSEEGLPRPIGEYIVKLDTYTDSNGDNHLSCQCCRVKRPRFFRKPKKHIEKKPSLLKKIGF